MPAVRRHLAAFGVFFLAIVSSAYLATLIAPQPLFVRAFIALSGMAVIGLGWVYVFRTRWPRWQVLGVTMVASTAAGAAAGAVLPSSGPVVAMAAGFATLALCASPLPGRRRDGKGRRR